MVDKEVVIETVKKMYASGIGDETVKETLGDIGLGRDEIESVMAEAKGAGKPLEGAGSGDLISEKTAESMREHIDSAAEEQALAHTTTHAALEEHGERLGEVHNSVQELRERISSIQSPPELNAVSAKLSSVEKKLIKLEKDLGEIKASEDALQSLLKKVLLADKDLATAIAKKK
ncbi:MAG: hypothetical protein V1494_00170 [Candidatus Diapherotrites archaeon]